MSIDTKTVSRRILKFAALDDIVAEVERLNQGKVRALGNWTPGQILKHLAIVMVWSLDGAPVKAPWIARIFGWFMKNRFISNPMPAGFKLPDESAAHLVPGPTTWEEGLQAFRAAIARLKAENQRQPSPFLGELTREQWDMLHCRHSELHLSFLDTEPASLPLSTPGRGNRGEGAGA
jgi:hypothetical protein